MSNHRGLFILNGKVPEATTDILRWGRAFGDGDSRRVAETQVGDVWVSTIFMGLDHNYSRQGPPILFETMAFVGGVSADQLRDVFLAGNFIETLYVGFARYATWDEAERGHADAVADVESLAGMAGVQADELLNRLRALVNNG